MASFCLRIDPPHLIDREFNLHKFGPFVIRVNTWPGHRPLIDPNKCPKCGSAANKKETVTHEI